MAVHYATVVTCPECGRRREVSARHARRHTRCIDCAQGRTGKLTPTDRERRYMLRRFTDVEIVTLAGIIWQGQGSLRHCHRERVRLQEGL